MDDSSQGSAHPHPGLGTLVDTYRVSSSPATATTADQLWATFAPALAADKRVRIARDGRNYRRGWERRVDVRRPQEPAAVRTYNNAGDAWMVPFDLDAKKNGSRAAVRRDCERLTAWLTEANCSYFVDESPNGGRHVYVLLDHPRSHSELAALAQDLRASLALPTLDPSPLINLSEGCIRPPGSAHRSGGHQQLVTPLGQAVAALHRPTSRDSWEAFLTQLPTAPPRRLDIDLRNPAVGAGDPTNQRPLAPDYERIARTGQYPADRYPSASEARAAVLLHALNRGWTEKTVTAAVRTSQWAGLTGLFEAKYGRRYRDKALAADLDRAKARMASSPLQRSHTSAAHPRGVGAKAQRRHLRRWLSCVALAVQQQRWSTRQSYGAELVLLAVADASRRRQSSYIDFGVRHLSMGSGTVLDWSTVASLLRQLRSEDDPFLLLVDTDRAAGADVYELRIPDAYLEHLPDSPDQLPAVSYGVHPAFSVLPLPAWRIYQVLSGGRSLDSVDEVAGAASVPIRTAYAVLGELRRHGLARRAPTGWVRGRRSLDRVASLGGVTSRLNRLVATWRLERNAWRAVLGLPTKDYPRTGAVCWPGSPPTGRPPDRSTPAVIDLVATAEQLLHDVLGAVRMAV